MAGDTDLTFRIEGPNGEREEVVLPEALVDLLDENDDPAAEVVADVVQMAFTSRAHMIAHHTEEEPNERVEAAERRALELFEERFGVSYAEATGHDH